MTYDKSNGRPPEPKIHNRVKVLRVERGLSRKRLAEELGVNYQTVGYIERGEYNPSLELAFRTSEFFGLPIEALFSREPFRPLSEELYGATSAACRVGGGDGTAKYANETQASRR